MKTVRVFLAVVLVFILSSCGLKPMWDILGKWEQVGGATTLEVLQNGTVNVTGPETAVSARYVLVKPKQMQIVMAGLGSMDFSLDVENGKLILTNSEGNKVEFQKVK